MDKYRVTYLNEDNKEESVELKATSLRVAMAKANHTMAEEKGLYFNNWDMIRAEKVIKPKKYNIERVPYSPSNLEHSRFNGFSKGVPISDLQIQMWINEGTKILEEDITKQVWYSRTGNTMVILTRYFETEITVYVCKGYESCYPKVEEVKPCQE